MNYVCFRQVIYCILFTTYCHATSVNLYQPHAFSQSSARDLLEITDFYIDRNDIKQWTFAGNTEYLQNLNNNIGGNLGVLPFWSGTNTMTLGTNDGLSDVDLYQFGLGDATTQGSITLCPKIQQVATNFLLLYVQDKLEPSIYFKINVPFGAMMVTTKLYEKPAQLDDSPDLEWLAYPTPGNRYSTLTQAFQGGSGNADGSIASNLHKPIDLEKGRISGSKLTLVRFGDLSTTFGYNFVNRHSGFFGAGFKCIVPTSNAPTATFVLEPVFDGAAHWGVGAECSGFYQLWDNDKGQCLTFCSQAEVMHLMSGRRPNWRAFDLKENGPGSKYLLTQYYYPGNPTTDNPSGETPGFITQAVNITTMPVFSKFDVTGSVALMLDYQHKNWNLNLGAEFWARSRECLDLDYGNIVNQNCANLNDYAILGRQISEYYDTTSATSAPLYFCEPLAYINKSEDRVTPISVNPTVLPSYNTDQIKDARLASNRIPAVLTDALDICGAQASRIFTGKLFGQIGYSFIGYNSEYAPYLSVFGSLEFASKCSQTPCFGSIGIQYSLMF